MVVPRGVNCGERHKGSATYRMGQDGKFGILLSLSQDHWRVEVGLSYRSNARDGIALSSDLIWKFSLWGLRLKLEPLDNSTRMECIGQK